MLDFGLPELLLIIAITVIVIGPKEIPVLMFKFGKLVQRLNGLKYALSKHFDHFMQDFEHNSMMTRSSQYDQDISEHSRDNNDVPIAQNDPEALADQLPDDLEATQDLSSNPTMDLFDEPKDNTSNKTSKTAPKKT